MKGHAVVQHSAFGYKSDPTFAHALETRTVTAAQGRKVLAAGGRVFPTYTEAEDFAEQEHYPTGYEGFYPRASGTFVSLKIDGLAVYVPNKGEGEVA